MTLTRSLKLELNGERYFDSRQPIADLYWISR